MPQNYTKTRKYLRTQLQEKWMKEDALAHGIRRKLKMLSAAGHKKHGPTLLHCIQKRDFGGKRR